MAVIMDRLSRPCLLTLCLFVLYQTTPVIASKIADRIDSLPAERSLSPDKKTLTLTKRSPKPCSVMFHDEATHTIANVLGFCVATIDLENVCKDVDIDIDKDGCAEYTGHSCCYEKPDGTPTTSKQFKEVAPPLETSAKKPEDTAPKVAEKPSVPTDDKTPAKINDNAYDKNAKWIGYSHNLEDPKDIQMILDVLNDVRRRQRAANMLELSWDPMLAKHAQNWADKCVWDHGQVGPTNSTSYTSCGTQNMGHGWSIPGLLQSMETKEVDFFVYGQSAKDGCCLGKNVCGHHRTHVSAYTHQVGCGYNMCEGKLGAAILVCNYCPGPIWYDPKVCSPYVKGTPENGGVCGKCGGLKSARCVNGLCTVQCPLPGKDKVLQANCNKLMQYDPLTCEDDRNKECKATCDCLA